MTLLTETVQFGAVGAPYWFDKPTIIVGAGPSMKKSLVPELQGLGYIIAVNGAMKYFPKADAWVTIDSDFVRNNVGLLQEGAAPLYICLPRNDCIGGHYGPRIDRATYLRREMNGGRLSENPNYVECGGTSGFAAFNVAFHKRTRFIVLFGFDYDYTAHFCEEDYVWSRATPDWALWGQMFNPLWVQLAGIHVLNASPYSKLTAFRKATHDDALVELQNWTLGY